MVKLREPTQVEVVNAEWLNGTSNTASHWSIWKLTEQKIILWTAESSKDYSDNKN